MEQLGELQRGFEQSGFWRLLGIRVHYLQPGEAVICVNTNDSHLNLSHKVHGGVIATLLDCAMGLTLRSIEDIPFVTQSLTTQFLSAPKGNGPLYANAQVIRKGKRIICMQGSVTDSDERLIAQALATFVVL